VTVIKYIYIVLRPYRNIDLTGLFNDRLVIFVILSQQYASLLKYYFKLITSLIMQYIGLNILYGNIYNDNTHI